MALPTDDTDMRWPEGAVVYHIYPRSLQDSNGDGIGDLRGILQRLDYIKSLGVTVIWLSPFYPSPMADFGYDVADYTGIDPIFGTMQDFDALLQGAHNKGIKVMIDLVPNHTSDEHRWFQESKQSKTNPYSDWYVWRGPAGFDQEGQPNLPNNWREVFTGAPAWEWNEDRQQFYLHSYDIKQPDLNWANPEVREAFKDVMRFWLDKGVDGFRVDAVYWMGKDPLFSDDLPNPDYVEGQDWKYNELLHDNSRGWPQVYAYLSEMADVLKEYPNKLRFMVTEAYPEGHNPLTGYLSFYVGVDSRVAAPFNFEGIWLRTAQEWRRFLKPFHLALEQLGPHPVASYAFGNHDNPRLIGRLGSEEAARAAAVLLLTLPGMVFIYYGEEIGMHDVEIPPELARDPQAPAGNGRDPERTPMQWSPDKHAGFTTGDSTWLPVALDYKTRNVETESNDPGSLLALYRQLGALRARSPAFTRGRLKVINTYLKDVLGYLRYTDKEAYLVLVNFSEAERTCHLLSPGLSVDISSRPDSLVAPGTEEIVLASREAVVLAVRPEACSEWP